MRRSRTLIDRRDLDAMRAEAVEAWPREACGALFGRCTGGHYTVAGVKRLRNVAVEPERGYEVDRAELASSLGDAPGELLGFFHSHPNGGADPSRDDVDCAWNGSLYIIVPCSERRAGAVRAWSAEAESWTELDIDDRGPG